jgi:uncharacterized membrane protein
MHTIEEAIDIDVPIRAAYDQWTQFEQFPKFMEGVKEVRQIDERRLTWRAEILGKEVSWDAEITHQVPDDTIAWRSTSGAQQDGSIKFVRIGDQSTRLVLRLTYEPQSASDKTASALGLVTARVKGDLKRFKKFIEERGVATGQWRGEIHSGHVTRRDQGDSSGTMRE